MAAVARMKFQMINSEGMFCQDEVTEFIGGLSANEKITVVSIIGPQGCGKSTLLNALFETDFTVLPSNRNFGQTTHGIWIARWRNNPSIVIIDVEGSDSTARSKEDEMSFDVRTALLAFIISDVLLLNLKVSTLGQSFGGCETLLRALFQEKLSLSEAKTEVVATLRDCNVLNDPNDQVVVKNIMEECWKSGPLEGRFDDSIEVSVVQFPYATNENRSPDFVMKLAELRMKLTATCNAISSQDGTPTAAMFIEKVNKIWEQISTGSPNIPSLSGLMSNSRCETIMENEKSQLFKNEIFCALMNIEGTTSPETFQEKLNELLVPTLAKFEGRVQAAVCSEGHRKHFKLKLENDIYIKLKDTFLRILMGTKHEIAEAKKETISIELKKKKKYVLSSIFKLTFIPQAFDSLDVDGIVDPHVKEFENQFQGCHEEYKTNVKTVRADLKKALNDYAQQVRKKIEDDYKFMVNSARVLSFGVGAVGLGGMAYYCGVRASLLTFGAISAISAIFSVASNSAIWTPWMATHVTCILKEIILPAARNAAIDIGMVAGEHIENLVLYLSMSMLNCLLNNINGNIDEGSIGERNFNAIIYEPSAQRLLLQY